MTENFVQAENFKKINGKKGKVMVEHQLWGKQVFSCEEIVVVEDDNRLGVCIQGHDVYVHKNDIRLYKQHERMIIAADRTVQLTIIYE